MTDYESVVRRLREANPAPSLAALHEEELEALRSLLDRRRGKMTATSVPSGTAPRWRRPALAIGAAFVVTLAAVGTTLLLLRGAEEAPPVTSVTTTLPPTTTLAPSTTLAPTTTAATTTTAPPTTTTTVPAFPDALGMTWTRVPDQEAFRGGNIVSAIQGGPGFVAVGASMDGWNACVWLSADGLTWERITSPAFAGEPNQFGVESDQYMADVAAGPQGLVAVGADNRAGAVVWTSPDGRSWTRLPEDPDVLGSGNAPATLVSQMNAVIAAGPGFVAVGSADNNAAVWTSADGRTWTRAFTWRETAEGHPALGGPSQTLTDVVAWEGRLYAVGWTGWANRNDPPSTWDPYHPIVLVSEDGLAWDMLPQAASPGEPGVDFGTSWPDVAAQTITGTLIAYDGGLVAGNDRFSDGRPQVLQSRDGEAWVRTGRFLLHDTASIVSLLAHGDRLLAAMGPAEIWGSVDGGNYWHRIARLPLGTGAGAPGGTQLWGPGNYVSKLLAVGDTVMAFGMDSVYAPTENLGTDYTCNTGVTGCRADAAIWIGTFDNG